jgi:hypothetical protein
MIPHCVLDAAYQLGVWRDYISAGVLAAMACVAARYWWIRRRERIEAERLRGAVRLERFADALRRAMR